MKACECNDDGECSASSNSGYGSNIIFKDIDVK